MGFLTVSKESITMTIKVIIESEELNERSGTSARTGKPYRMREQQARLSSPLIAGPFRITLDDSQAAYSVGEYELDFERSLRFGSFSSLEFRPVFRRLQDQKTAAPLFSSKVA